MRVLGIETSCDETAVSVLDVGDNKITVLSNTISSQIKLHAKYGGVVPNLAAREHVKNIKHVFKLALKEAAMYEGSPTSLKLRRALRDIDLIAVTRGPGLGPALLVGITFAKTIAWKYKKPLIGTNHLHGHIYSNWLNEDFKIKAVTFPILNLIVSGGHTELILMNDYGKFKQVGETLDDAVGEAFDKVARLLNLGYPGGPAISKIADKGDASRFKLPRPMLHSKDLNFSYSGLKTAVLYLIRDLKQAGTKIDKKIKADIAASFQAAAIDVLIQKTLKALNKHGVNSIMLSGGVSANNLLRSEFKRLAEDNSLHYSYPKLTYTGDNAAMIALAGYFSLKNPPSSASWRTTEGTVKNSWKSVEMDSNLGF